MNKSHYIIPIFVPHLGCPHNCVFCNQDTITGSVKQVTPKEVKNTIESYLKTIKNRDATIEVSFFGGTFTAIEEKIQRELLEVAKDYKDRGFINQIHMSTRPDYINDYILSYLKEYSVDVIELGVQSLDNDVLKAAGRGHDADIVVFASNLIKKYGIILGHQIMPGLPKSNFEKDLETARRSIEMEPDICRIYPALVIKDTPMEFMYNKGIYKPYTLEQAVQISSKIMEMYKEAGVNVIRAGLQPTDTINEGKDVIAGPFHPAFRELVEGYTLCNQIKEKLTGKSGTVKINQRDLSKLYTNKKIYFNKLIENGYRINVEVSDKIKRGNIIII